METKPLKTKTSPRGNLTGQLVVFAWVGLAVWLRWYTTSPLDQARPHQTEIGEVRTTEEVKETKTQIPAEPNS